MTNNDILRRIRYAFDFNDDKMIALFGLADCRVTREQVCAWLKKDDDPTFQECSDTELAIFLNGMIIDNRGKKGAMEPERRLDNNLILKKLRIALSLKSEDILELLDLAGMNLSEHELSAFLRKPGHRHYRVCKDQVLRKFLQGVQQKYRVSAEKISD